MRAANLFARLLHESTERPSALAAQMLGSMGYDQVEALEGGLNAWVAAELPLDGDQRSQ